MTRVEQRINSHHFAKFYVQDVAIFLVYICFQFVNKMANRLLYYFYVGVMHCIYNLYVENENLNLMYFIFTYEKPT